MLPRSQRRGVVGWPFNNGSTLGNIAQLRWPSIPATRKEINFELCMRAIVREAAILGTEASKCGGEEFQVQDINSSMPTRVGSRGQAAPRRAEC